MVPYVLVRIILNNVVYRVDQFFPTCRVAGRISEFQRPVNSEGARGQGGRGAGGVFGRFWLALFQRGPAYAHHIITLPRDFQTFLRPCSGAQFSLITQSNISS